MYLADENATFVQICVITLGGNENQRANIILSTQSSTALGK